MENKISICIPNFNRTGILVESFIDVYWDERVEEIIISDDCSDIEKYEHLQQLFEVMPKVKMYRNSINLDCFRNKRRSVELASNDFVILFDSDNKLSKDYLDKIYSEQWFENTIYTPSFAAPNFDFRAYEGLMITKENVADYIYKPLFEVALNAANYFINKSKWLEVWDGSVDPVTSDSIFVAYKWLEAGNKIKVVPSLEYFHRVWEESHYQNNVHRTPNGFHESILKKLRELK
jgi:glycosyltransferase involved in cell wall biosynthesis